VTALPDNAHVIAIDLGGTNFRVALCDARGGIVRRVRHATRPEEGAATVIARMVQAARELEADSPNVLGVGVASPGPLNPFTGVVLYVSTLNWRDVPLRDELSRALGLPVQINNDANLAALGEQQFGAARGHADIAYVTLSTGIGCGVILGNRLVLGARGLATELGNTSVEYNSPHNYSGLPGALEGLAAGPAIAALAQRALAEGRSSLLRELAGGRIEQVSAREVGEAANRADALALAVVNHAARVIGIGIVNLLHLFDPALVVIGGSVALMGEVLLRPLRDTVRECAMPPYQSIPLVPAQLGDDSGLLGAAALAWQAHRP
jgi:glucokinase